MNFWEILGISPTTDLAAIRHAYAEKTRACHPEEDPEGFDKLHTAFQEATQYARRSRRAAPAAPQAEKRPAAAPAAPAVAGTRESCLAAEQAAYLAWMKKNGSAARQAGEQTTFDFSAAETAPRRAPARPREPGDEEEQPPAAQTPLGPQPQFDFDHLPQQVSRQRRQQAQELVDQLRAACGPDAGRWQARELLESEEFRALQHAPEFLETLVKFLKTEPACLEKLAVDLAYAYGLPKPGEGSGPAPDAFHEELFALLRPIWQAHWQKAREQNAKEAATPGRIYAVIVGLSAFIAMLATQDAFHPALRLLLAFLGGAAGVAVMLLAQRMQARGWLSSTAVLLLRLLQLFFLALFFFGVGPASAAGLLACFVAAALPGRKWYFRQSKQTRFTLTAACAVLSVIWVPVSFVVMPSITDDVAFCAIFGWCVLPLAFIRCIVSNCRFYKLAARYGL